jgi:hypothetical protein
MYLAMYARCIWPGHRGTWYRGEGRPGSDEMTIVAPGPEFGTWVLSIGSGGTGRGELRVL